MKEFSYPKAEKLKQKREITLLFSKGKWKTNGNLRMVFVANPEAETTGEIQNKIGVSVSKRYFKKAVDRNRIKRLLREAYRRHKPEFEEKFGHNTLVMIFWVSSQKPTHYTEVEESFLKLCK